MDGELEFYSIYDEDGAKHVHYHGFSSAETSSATELTGCHAPLDAALACDGGLAGWMAQAAPEVTQYITDFAADTEREAYNACYYGYADSLPNRGELLELDAVNPDTPAGDYWAHAAS